MVLLADTGFNDKKYNVHFESYPFDLSVWQKFAIKSIVDKNHCLVVAPTGNGKTLPAEFAINYFHTLKKKVIFTSPIKALSNQKYWDFKNKFPHISFGLLTGDIKDNPDADCIICTTEILRNNCYNKKSCSINLDFNINLQEEVGAVVFDEVHYINDKDRGNVWEECFMLLPQNVQLIMLSATIANPERFAGWVESIDKPMLCDKKQVVICSTDKRIVPSFHYYWFASPTNLITKKINDPNTIDLVNKYNNKLTLFKENSNFNDKHYHDICKLKYLLGQEYIYGKQSFVLNELLKHLKEKNILPAICFVYSRKNVEKFANMCSINLFEDGGVKTNMVQKECEKILRRLPNFKEYLILPEYKQIIKNLEKGIGIHHAGILPVFKEMIELLFDKGYIRLLFATETFAVGINFPAPTVIFTDVEKFDGSGKRMLLPHEFTQQSGRAGRRGFDERGYVIHLVNLFNIPELSEYKIMMNNKPQHLISKFKISYPLLLNIYKNNESPVIFANESMIKLDIQCEIDYLKSELEKETENLSSLTLKTQNCTCSEELINDVLKIEKELPYLKNKKKIKSQRLLGNYYNDNSKLEEEIKLYYEIEKSENILAKINKQLEYTTLHIAYNVGCVKEILEAERFITFDDKNDKIILSNKGEIATNIKEIHSLVLSDILEQYDSFNSLSGIQLAVILSCFTNINVNEEYKDFEPKCSDYQISQVVTTIKEKLDYYYNLELKNEIYTGLEYNINYDLINYIESWWNTVEEKDCVTILNSLYNDKNIFIGEFVKAILKINNIASEIETIAESLSNMELLEKCRQIHTNTFKFIATNQSLYV